MVKKKILSPFIVYDDSLLGCEEPCDKEKKIFKCSVCRAKLSSKDTLKKHILHKHIKLKPYRCEICSKKFIFERELLRHQSIHDDTISFNCFCGVIFKTKSSFKYHQKNFHIPNFPVKCSICFKLYKDKWRLKNHIQSSHFPQSFRCSFISCGKIFSTKALLHNHQMTHSKIRYKCSICKKKFKLWHYKEIHEKSHNGFRPFKCKECGKTYLTISHLNGHWKKEHLQVRNFLCSVCGKTFKTKFEVISHEHSHLDKMFECDSCDFESLSKRSLNIHKKTHLSENSLVSLSKQTYMVHETKLQQKKVPHYIINSSENLPYRCVDCEKCFRTAVRANEHWRRYHLIIANFRCSFCPKIFHGKLELSEHLQNSHQEISYKCEFCDFTTQFKIALFSHNKKHKFLGRNEEIKEHKKTKKELIIQRVYIKKRQNGGVSTCQKLSKQKETKSLKGSKEKNLPLGNRSANELKVNNKSCGSGKNTSKNLLPSINNHASTKLTNSKRRDKKLKKNVFNSLASDIKMTYYGDEDYESISNLFGETPFLSYLDVVEDKDCVADCSNVLNNNNNAFEGRKKTSNFQSIYKSKSLYNWSGFKADPKLTLNCTAENDCEDLFDI